MDTDLMTIRRRFPESLQHLTRDETAELDGVLRRQQHLVSAITIAPTRADDPIFIVFNAKTSRELRGLFCQLTSTGRTAMTNERDWLRGLRIMKSNCALLKSEIDAQEASVTRNCHYAINVCLRLALIIEILLSRGEPNPADNPVLGR